MGQHKYNPTAIAAKNGELPRPIWWTLIRIGNGIEGENRMNCKNCGYKYCPFSGIDREIPAYFCEDFEEKREES